MVWVSREKLPEHVQLLVFVVAAYSGGSLGEVDNSAFHVLQDSDDNEIAHFELARTSKSVDVVAAMFRTFHGWSLRLVDEAPPQHGQHFMDILPMLAAVIRQFIPAAPKRQKVAFAMEKG